MSEPDALPASESADRTGQLLGEKYRLLRLLGEGGMGAVYEAVHVVVKRRFAVKLLHDAAVRKPDALRRFRLEAESAGALESEHVTAVTDYGIAADGTPFLVMEYLAGESVGSLLAREGPLPLARAAGIVLQACRGLEVAHAAGIVHRDLKPDNLFLVRRADGSELVKLLDFGLAKLEAASERIAVTRTGAVLGTPAYMAPEQARGDKSIGAGADIYALGVVLYELLSGEKPHPGDSYNAILAHILTQKPLPLASRRNGLPAGLVRTVERALAFERDDRHRTVEELAGELRRFAGAETLLANSQLELRTLPRAAPTLATADTVDTPDALTTPRAARKRSSWRYVALLVVLGISAAFGAYALRGTARDATLEEPVAPAGSVPSNAGTDRRSELAESSAQKADPQTSFAPVAAGAAATAPVAAAPPAPAKGRSSVTFGPQAERSSRLAAEPNAERTAPSAAPVKAPPVPTNSVHSGAIAGSPGAARGARFDPKNPYR